MPTRTYDNDFYERLAEQMDWGFVDAMQYTSARRALADHYADNDVSDRALLLSLVGNMKEPLGTKRILWYLLATYHGDDENEALTILMSVCAALFVSAFDEQ